MPRIPYYDVDQATGKHAEFLDKLKPHLNIYRMLANSENGLEGLRAHGQCAAAIAASSIPPCASSPSSASAGSAAPPTRSSSTSASPARSASSEDKIAALRDATIEAPAFTDNEKAVLRFTDDVVRNVKRLGQEPEGRAGLPQCRARWSSSRSPSATT